MLSWWHLARYICLLDISMIHANAILVSISVITIPTFMYIPNLIPSENSWTIFLYEPFRHVHNTTHQINWWSQSMCCNGVNKPSKFKKMKHWVHQKQLQGDDILEISGTYKRAVALTLVQTDLVKDVWFESQNDKPRHKNSVRGFADRKWPLGGSDVQEVHKKYMMRDVQDRMCQCYKILNVVC